MRKLSLFLYILILVSTTAISGCASSANSNVEEKSGSGNSNQVVKIGLASWIGFAPMYLAEEKGFFKKHGVNVQLQTIQSASDKRTAMAANRIQGFMSTVDTHVMTAAANIPVQQVLALDTSSGGDGIIAKKEIKNIKDLKGKKVALDTSGGASYFWFMYILDQNGMKMKDVNVVNMSAGDAGAAFVGKKVDAAVTWQPWLTKATKTSFGHVLLSSEKTPGLIVDSLGLRTDFIKENPKLVQGIINAWFDALEYAKKNPDKADKIMADKMGQSIEEFKTAKQDVTFYGKSDNQKYFGTNKNDGLIWDVTKKASDFWLQVGLTKEKPSTKELINSKFVSN